MMLILLYIACSDKSIVGENDSDGNIENTHLIGDSNVFLEDPIAEMDVSSTDDSEVSGDDTGDLENVQGILLYQNGGELEVRHFGVELDCDWTLSDINIQYFTSNVSQPYVGAFNADYGSSGSCTVDLEYTISLYDISNDFIPGLHVFLSNNEQIIIDLVGF
jgi:hypothetical protein